MRIIILKTAKWVTYMAILSSFMHVTNEITNNVLIKAFLVLIVSVCLMLTVVMTKSEVE